MEKSANKQIHTGLPIREQKPEITSNERVEKEYTSRVCADHIDLETILCAHSGQIKSHYNV